MKYRSSKTAAICRIWNPIREQYALDMKRCAVCQCWGVRLDVHEILAGAYRHRAFVEPACWLALCRQCHDKLQSTSITSQLAYKLLADPEHYDLAKFAEAWDRVGYPAFFQPEILSFVHKIWLERHAA